MSSSPAEPRIRQRALPINPCSSRACRYHRLNCGHIVKASAVAEPCGPNCMNAPAEEVRQGELDNREIPFLCPVCIKGEIFDLFQDDLVFLRRQLLSLSLPDFAAWIRRNYKTSWRRRVNRFRERREGENRVCTQIDPDVDSVVVMATETAPPYGTDQFRLVMHEDFFLELDIDPNSFDNEGEEAEPGVVYPSIESDD